jgi:hypothetical protein
MRIWELGIGNWDLGFRISEFGIWRCPELVEGNLEFKYLEFVC